MPERSQERAGPALRPALPGGVWSGLALFVRFLGLGVAAEEGCDGTSGRPRRTAPPPGFSTDSLLAQARRKEVLEGRAGAGLGPGRISLLGEKDAPSLLSAHPLLRPLFPEPACLSAPCALPQAVRPVVQAFPNPVKIRLERRQPVMQRLLVYTADWLTGEPLPL